MVHTLPTPDHREVVATVVDHFEGIEGVDCVLLVASCARGVATTESDLDVAVIVVPESRDPIEKEWFAFRETNEAIQRFTERGPFSALHLDVIDGRYEPIEWDDGGGPDGFELEVGNQIAYSVPLLERTSRFQDLRRTYLPYYDEALAESRAAMSKQATLHDLDAVTFFAGRGLHFAAFDRLYKAFQEFLQALFITRRTYPIAYNKWIRYQVCDLLGEPNLYAELPTVLEVPSLVALAANRDLLAGLVRRWI